MQINERGISSWNGSSNKRRSHSHSQQALTLS